MKHLVIIMTLLLMWVAASCSKRVTPENSHDSETAPKNTSTDSQTATDSVTPTASDTQSGTETGTETGTIVDSDTDTHSETGSESDRETDTGNDSEKDTSTGSDTISDTETDPETDADTESDTNADTDNDTDNDTESDTESDTAGTDTGADTETDTDPSVIMNPDCIRIDKVKSTEYAPAAVRVTFRLLDCSGYPVRKLTSNDVSIINNVTGNDFNASSEGGGASAPDLPSEFGFFSVLALDMSDSIFNNDRVNDVINGAKIFVDRMVTNAPENQKQKVAILVFGRTNAISIVQDFTSNDELLNNTLDSLLISTSLGTTNLYGGYVAALDAVTKAGAALELVERSVVILTDGTHEAGDETNLRNVALSAKMDAELNSDTTIFSIGIQGDYDETKLAELASKDDYFVMAENAGALEQTFSEVARTLENIAHSNYVVGVCTPVELGNPSLTINVDMGTASDSETVFYSTDNLSGDLNSCVPEVIASPCDTIQCGSSAILGFSCGRCKDTTEWCNDGVCVEGCANLECGTSPVGNINCGICTGATEWCNGGSCEDDCAELNCGASPNENFNCGTCSAATEWCNAGTCVNGCDGLTCGTSPDGSFNCGTCSGATEWCSAGTCVEGCANRECGMSPTSSVNCGTCTGANEWCNEGTCEEQSSQVTWISLSGGTFSMGSNYGETNETPVHTVTVGDFEMLKTEVTAAQYEACVTAGICSPRAGGLGTNYGIPGKENHPMVYVIWNDAFEYCAWIGGRLPSEAEWEYAARSEGKDIKYPWGDMTGCNYAFYSGCSTAFTEPVCSLPDGNTDQGLCDMAGNAAELVQDQYHDTFTGAPGDGSPWEDGNGEIHVVKNGSFMMSSFRIRATYRWGIDYLVSNYGVGFRCTR